MGEVKDVEIVLIIDVSQTAALVIVISKFKIL